MTTSTTPDAALRNRTVRHQLACQHCAGSFSSVRRNAKYCGPNCSSLAYHARRKADGRAEQMVAKRRTPRTCIQCGIEFLANAAWIKYCSNSCQAAYEHGPGRRPKRKAPLTERQRRARAKLRRAAKGTTGGHRRWTQGPCFRCGEQFMAMAAGRTVLIYCSRRCNSADKRERRRARQAGVRLTKGRRYAVFLQDGWICQLCNFAVDPTAVVPDFNAATVDHRIPLAQFGPHAPENWQTAHFICNSIKRDTFAAENLILQSSGS